MIANNNNNNKNKTNKKWYMLTAYAKYIALFLYVLELSYFYRVKTTDRLNIERTHEKQIKKRYAFYLKNCKNGTNVEFSNWLKILLFVNIFGEKFMRNTSVQFVGSQFCLNNFYE